MDQQLGWFAAHDVISVIGLCVTFAGALAGCVWRILSWLRTDSAKHTRALERSIVERNARFERVSQEITRVDREIAEIRLEFATALARLPTRPEIDAMLTQRMEPLTNSVNTMSNDVRTLIVELARAGVRAPSSTPKEIM